MADNAQMIIDLDRKRMQAMADTDIATLNTLLADDLIYTHSSARLDTKESLISNMQSGSTVYNAVEPSDVKAQDLGNAVVQASDSIKSNCPTSVAFTPTGRLAAMQQRLQGMVQAVNIVEPPLGKFYDSLNDEQKARFDAMGAATAGAATAGATTADAATAGQGRRNQPPAEGGNPQAACGSNVTAWPADKIDRVVQPNDAQRAKLDALQSAAAQAADAIKAACPSGEPPHTPPGRLAAVGKRLQAMLQAVETVQPALQDFYNSLGDDQRARFNTMGRQLSAVEQ